MTSIKKKEEIEILREGGRRLAQVLKILEEATAPGITTEELNDIADKFIRDNGDTPSFLDYKPRGAKRPFPSSLCISLNDEIVHGIPTEDPISLKEGDIVSYDIGVTHKGLITDAAITVPVGEVSEESKKLINITREALSVGVKAARVGNTTGDIGYAIESFVEPHGYGIPDDLGGHGVGYYVHEDPDVPNYGDPGSGTTLKEGMVLALEPMLLIGGNEIKLDADGYTYKTANGKRSAHFEHTIVITNGAPEILTKE